MNEHNGTLTNGLFYRAWAPDAPKALVLLTHGLGEHIGRYDYVARKLVAGGFAVYGMDHVGHGQSPGERCFVEAFEDYLEGVDVLYALACGQHPSLPVVLLGHSMGGLIAASAALREPDRFSALVLSGPAVIPPSEPSTIAKFMARLLSKYAPTRRVLALDAKAISRDADVVSAYLQDPLVFNGKITARLASELFDAMGLLRDRAGDLTIPVLLMHGSADRLTAPSGSELLHDRATSTDKTLQIYDGLFHEIFNEPERDRVIDDLLDWLNARLPQI